MNELEDNKVLPSQDTGPSASPSPGGEGRGEGGIRGSSPKVSIVIISWNDRKYILDCLDSVYAQTRSISFEVIIADNGSTDGSRELIRERFPNARIVENNANLGFGPGNNAGIALARGEYVFILNPDTIVHERAVEKLVAYADAHPQAGAFGCRTLNQDGTLQHTARPLPTVWRSLIAALYLRWLGNFSNAFISDTYLGWDGRTEREIGFQAGCSLLVRGELLKSLGGFDARFFHQFEDADLCRRVWSSGRSVLFCPHAEITHIGGQKRGGYPVKVVLETERSKYRYFHKHGGVKALKSIRLVSLLALGMRYAGYRLLHLVRGGAALDQRLELYRVLFRWNWQINPVQFIQTGQEPALGYEPLSPARLIAVGLV